MQPCRPYASALEMLVTQMAGTAHRLLKPAEGLGWALAFGVRHMRTAATCAASLPGGQVPGMQITVDY